MGRKAKHQIQHLYQKTLKENEQYLFRYLNQRMLQYGKLNVDKAGFDSSKFTYWQGVAQKNQKANWKFTKVLFCLKMPEMFYLVEDYTIWQYVKGWIILDQKFNTVVQVIYGQQDQRQTAERQIFRMMQEMKTKFKDIILLHPDQSVIGSFHSISDWRKDNQERIQQEQNSNSKVGKASSNFGESE